MIKVLFLASDPFKQNPLALDEEIRAITAKIRSAEYRDALELVSAWAVRPDDLQQLLLQHRPHVVHFSGHGSQAEQLILKDQNGQPKPVSKPALVGLFKVLKDDIRVAVLNACHSKPQAEAIANVIDCAIGMNAAIGDAAAIVFAAAFYRALGFGKSVQTAFELGTNALMLESIPEEETPELLVRNGVDASQVFLLNPRLEGTGEQKNPLTPGRPVDRILLLNALKRLGPSDLSTLITAIPGALGQVSRNATGPEKVAELVGWAESSTGPGLQEVHRIAQQVLENFR